MFRPFVFARLKLCGYDPESEDAAFAANAYGYEKMDALRCGGRFERFGQHYLCAGAFALSWKKRVWPLSDRRLILFLYIRFHQNQSYF